MPKYQIKHNKDICIGCGTCVGLYPRNWETIDDGKVKPKQTKIDKLFCNQEAADSCPVKAIEIIKVE